MALADGSNLIVVLGGKGGVGKSVFAANLACTLMQELKARTLLIDLDGKSAGDQNVILGVRPLKTVFDLLQYTGAITTQTLPSLVAQHSSGIGFVGAVHSPEQSLQGDPGLLKKQLHSLSQHFKFIVADLGNDMGPLQIAALEEATAGLLVATPEILVINQTKRLLIDLLSLSFPAEMFFVVLNRVTRGGLDPNVIAQTLRSQVLVQIPQDEDTALSALQRSTPVVLINPSSPMAGPYHDLVRHLTGGLLQRLKASTKPKIALQPGSSSASTQPGGLRSGGPAPLSPLTQLKMAVHTALIKEMDLKKDLSNSEGDPAKAKELRAKTQRVVSGIVDRLGAGLSRDERMRLIKEVLDEALGLGPLEDLLADPTVTEIMVNGANRIYIEKSGKLQLSQVAFTSNSHLRIIIERIVTPLGRRIDERTPYVDARLADGSRVNAIIEPLSIDGPAVTIRKFPRERITAEDYVNRFGSMTKPMVDFLKICVEQGLNLIISGGTGSGKTTLLNVLSGFIPANERIITVEDAAELQLKQEHVVRLETRPANMEGEGEISIRDLIRNSLRMRPDRIIVGECRDGAALDMLSAMNTGHDGSMTTVHSNSPREAISRLETLCLMAGMDLPARAIREQIAGAVDLIVQISRLSDGSRKILSITEVVGMQGDTITLQEIFRFKEEGFDKNRKIIGQFQAMGRIPTFVEEFDQRGVVLPRDLFTTQNLDAKPLGASPSMSSGVVVPSILAKKPTPSAPQAAAPPTPSSIKKKASGES